MHPTISPSAKIFCKYFYVILHEIDFKPPFDIEIVFSSIWKILFQSDKEHKVSLKVSGEEQGTIVNS